MNTPRDFVLLLVLASFTSGCGTLSKIDILRVVTSGRDGWQHPDRVVEAIGLKPGDTVAEIGAGSGYWLVRLSEAVGEHGRVYAVEVENELVEELRSFVAERELSNIVVVLGRYEDPLLPDASIDVAMTSLTYHHIEDRPEYFTALHQDLSPRGRVVHLDGRDDLPIPFRWLASKGHWSNIDAMNNEMRSAGYQRVTSFDFLPMESLQVFSPDAEDLTSAVDPGQD